VMNNISGPVVPKSISQFDRREGGGPLVISGTHHYEPERKKKSMDLAPPLWKKRPIQNCSAKAEPIWVLRGSE